MTGYYAAAGMIGRALVFLTAPMTQVMFPKVAQSAARSEKSNAALLALGATALIGAGAALEEDPAYFAGWSQLWDWRRDTEDYAGCVAAAEAMVRAV